MEANQSEELEITVLTKENEKQKKNNKTESKVSQKNKLQHFTCNDSTARIEKLNKLLDKEKGKSQQCLHKLTIEKETQISNLPADINSLRHQIDLSNKQCTNVILGKADSGKEWLQV